jgi:hypothetical protein
MSSQVLLGRREFTAVTSRSCVCQVLQKGPVTFPAEYLPLSTGQNSSVAVERRCRVAVYFSVGLSTINGLWLASFPRQQLLQGMLGELVRLTVFGKLHDLYQTVR